MLYLILGAGGLWHLLDVFQQPMRILASPIMLGLGAWLFSECWCASPQDEKQKISCWSIAIIIGSFGIEWFGVRTGLIFGSYQYGQTLRPSLDSVPISIGCAWFVMLIASTAVVQTVCPESITKSLFKLPCLVALLMVGFDMLMEPAAIKLDYWKWTNNRIPFQNYLAWFGLSFIFSTIGSHIGLFRRPLPRIALHFYFAQLTYFGLVNLKT